MRYVKPHYYDKFKCIADKCPDTCCAGWQIVIDEDSLEKYAGEPNLAGEIDWQEGIFKQYHGRCAMLNGENLCELIMEKGEDWLCDTCNRYPRHIEEFDGIREMSLSLSCPVAAEMMLQSEEPMRFRVEEDEEPDPLEDEFEDFDLLLFTQLEDAREVLFSIVQNREIPIDRRMETGMQMAREMQECLDEERLFEMEDVIGKYADYKTIERDEMPDRMADEIAETEIEKTRYIYLKENFALFHRLERLREEWTEVVDETEKTLYAGSEEDYHAIQSAFRAKFLTGFGEKKWEIFLEQILMFFLYTYFCGAVYDDCIYSKVGLAVLSVCYIREFIMCSWYRAGKQMNMQECIRMAYRYAREVEHSDENLNMFEEWLINNM